MDRLLSPILLTAEEEAGEAFADFRLPSGVWELALSLGRILLVIVLAYIINRVAKRLIKRLITSMKEQGVERMGKLRSRAPLADTRPLDLTRATMRTETIGGVLRSITTVVIMVIAVLMILGEVGVNLGPLIAGAGIVGVALGFGAQRLVQDFLSGIFMLLEDQYGIGDIIDAGEATGVVEGISLRTTRLRDIYGIVWHIPNGEIRRVGNHSQEWARALLDIDIAYGSDIDLACEVIKREADRMGADRAWGDMFLEEAEIWGVENLADSGVTIRVVAKVVPLQQWTVMREMRRRIKYAFDAAGVEIPFPQRTVWHRSEQLADAEGSAPIWGPSGRDRTT